MGNLGRAGFGASLEGLVSSSFEVQEESFGRLLLQWPYSYDSCDVGTLPNQTYPGQRLPVAATVNGDPQYGDVLVTSLPFSRARLRLTDARRTVVSTWPAVVSMHVSGRVSPGSCPQQRELCRSISA